MNYMFALINPGRNACYLKTLQEVEDDYELLKGISRMSNWPSKAFFTMDESFPDNIQLEDFIFNSNEALIISEKLRGFLTPDNLKNNEVLPVTIIDHKGRKIKEKYYILNQLNYQNCIDNKKSIGTINPLDPDEFMNITKLVINETLIDPTIQIFRMIKYPTLPIFKRELAESILEKGFTGIKFGEIEDYEGI